MKTSSHQNMKTKHITRKRLFKTPKKKENDGQPSKKKSKKRVTKDTVSIEPRKKKYTKTIISDTAIETGSEDEERVREKEAKIRFSVKRDWEGMPNYFPSNTKFEMFFPKDIKESEKTSWVDAVFKHKEEIESKVRDIFGDKEAVRLVKYGCRVRLRFPCPEQECSFSTVDMGKHLTGKHKWSKGERLLQTSYFHTMHDYVTKLKTLSE